MFLHPDLHLVCLNLIFGKSHNSVTASCRQKRENKHLKVCDLWESFVITWESLQERKVKASRLKV